jgi:hypothetical protein
MKGLTKNIKATVDLTGRQWEIFSPEVIAESRMADGEEVDLVQVTIQHNECVAALNAAATEALSCGNPSKAHGIFSKAQDAWEHFGAGDSEPSWEFSRLMREVYGDDY